MRLSEKQTEAYLLDAHDHGLVLCSGVVRSGKTWADSFGLYRYMAKYFNQCQAIIGVQS